MKQFLALIIIGAVTNSFSQSNTNICPIIPTPYHFETIQNQKPLIFNQIHFTGDEIIKEEHQIMIEWLQKLFPAKNQSSDKTLTIDFKLKADLGTAYEMIAIRDTIFISHGEQSGRLYAFSSLLQLMKNKGNHIELLPFDLIDIPLFPWRGQHLDVCRHFFTVEEVKRHIDLMAFYKFNKFHWHLTDDQAWRIEIKKYPRLTEIGAFRDSTLIGPYVTNPTNWDLTPKYGGFYTQEQIKEVVHYAQIRNITIIPEIEMPGHARAALAAYPELGCTGKRPPLIGYWGVFEEIFCSNEKTISFLQDVLSEVLELFPSEYIHIGGDEAPKTQWKACSVCQNTIQANNLKDEHELQSWFVRQMDDFLTKRGRKLLGWDEILEGGLSPNAAVMSWQGFEGGKEAATQKHEVVMTPTSYCYFDYYQGERTLEPHSIGGNVTLEKVFSFNPIPKELNSVYHKYILGAQANLWTEYIKTYDHVQYMMYPRALAMIEKLWTSPKKQINFQEFIAKLENRHIDILRYHNVNVATTFANPKLNIKPTADGLSIHFQSNASGAIKVASLIKNHIQARDTVITLKRTQVTSDSIIFSAKNEKYDRQLNFIFKPHKGIGLPVIFKTAPHPSYSKEAHIKLTDGIHSKRPWLHEQFVGFQSESIEMEVALDPQLTYRNMTISMLHAKGSWIHLPEKIVLYGSKNGRKWKYITSQDVNQEKATLNMKGQWKCLKAKIITLPKIPENMPGSGKIPFTFIDELILE